MAGSKGRSGGHRSGAGRKASEARVLGLIGRRDAQAEPVQVAPVGCPEGLETDVLAVWAELAPHATNARTLVPSTVPAFTNLCKAVVRHGKMQAQIERDGFTYLKVTIDGAGQEHTEVKAHPLISRAGALESLVRAWFKDFAIHPFGKAMAEAAVKPADPFAKFKAVG